MKPASEDISQPRTAESFRLHLQAELARRCARNGRYSLRAFARDLGTDHSTLSQILRGRRGVSQQAIRELGGRLGLDDTRIQLYVMLEQHSSPLPAARPTQAELLTRDAVAVLAGSHHQALRELCRLEDFRPDSRWVSRVLGVSVDQVNIAVSRLARLGLLRLELDRWVDCSGDDTASERAFPEVTLRRLFERLRDHSDSSTPALLPRRPGRKKG